MRIELYVMSFLQRNPGYLNSRISEIREGLNDQFGLQLEDDDVEAALLNINFGGDVKEIPDNFEWE